MPPNAQLLTAKEDSAYKSVFVWDLDLNPAGQYTQKILLKDRVSLGGKWALEVERTQDDLKIEIKFLDAGRVGRFGDAVKVGGQFAWIQAGVNGREHVFRTEQWYNNAPFPNRSNPPLGALVDNVKLVVTRAQFEQESQASGGLLDPAAHRHYRLIFQLSQAFPENKTSSTLALGGISSTPTPHDLRISFPRARKGGADLWTNADLLSTSSPYFRDLFASDFAEASSRRGKRTRKSSGKSTDDGPPTVALPAGDDFADSDEETDEFFFKDVAQKEQDEPSDDLSHRQVTVTQTAFSTYRALLVYLQTGFIDFMPPSSSLTSSQTDETPRSDLLRTKHAAEPVLPLPVSPKSAYRLAHLLQLPDLEKLCLDSFKAALTLEGAPSELFSDTSVCYEDWRKVVVDFIAARWMTVQQSPEWKDMLERQKRDEIPGAAAVLVELLQAVTLM
ncbi:hypothetical protein JCM6882_002896 [Rhodosporidiobolus microsporus]